MALDDMQLSLMAFPGRWTGSPRRKSPNPNPQLVGNLLLLPVGDPTAPLGSAGPVFAGTKISLTANVLAGLDDLPSLSSTPALTVPLVVEPPPVAPALFAKLADDFAANGITVTSGLLKPNSVSSARIKKSLPDSYVHAFPFETPRTSDVEVGDGYGCALRDQAPQANTKPPGPDSSIAWGQILSYALRQPILARALGLVHSFAVAVPPDLLRDGGFVYFTLDAEPPGNPWVVDWHSNPDTVKSYAARLPALGRTGRRLFAATLFPVVATPGSELAEAQLEAAEYDDGFAQIVHSNQPTTIDAATLQADRIAPATEAGVQIGWDDEQLTIWLNNQIDLLRARVGVPSGAAEAPLGVQGYRVDVRVAKTKPWRSLCAVNGTLPFDETGRGSGHSTSLGNTELWVAPAPVREAALAAGELAGPGNTNHAWLPLYFAQWAGASLVLADPTVALLAAAVAASGTGRPLPPVSTTLPNPNPDLTVVPVLRYGTDYEFRVRFVDLTGGGPLSTDEPAHPGPAPTALTRFRRHVPPKSLEVVASPVLPDFPAVPPAVRTIETLTITRPRINYPEAVFAGVDPATFDAANLGLLVAAAVRAGGSISVPDPDVGSFDVVVEARIPAHDTGLAGGDPGDLDGGFRVVYTVNVPFPGPPVADEDVMLTLDYTDGIDDISTIALPADGSTSIPIPTARDIRVRLYPRCVARPNYYVDDTPPVGLSSDFVVRRASATEGSLFPTNPSSQLRAHYFQPGSNLPQLLAQQLGVVQQGLTLTGADGVRTVFGASGALRHEIAPDGGSLTFANQAELLGHWIVAISLELERDWTWDGFAKPAPGPADSPPSAAMPSLGVARDGQAIGALVFPRVVAPAATNGGSAKPDRSRSRIVFLDAIDPAPAPGTFPVEPAPTYSVTANLEAAAVQSTSLEIKLPVTTPPSQTPKIAATGIVESEYVSSPDYSCTSPRDRFLWIEFDQPLADPDDAYFARVLAYGPDPLLSSILLPEYTVSSNLPESPEPDLPIDPEPVRSIFSGQSSDEAGLGAMTRLVPAISSGRGPAGTFFMLPLPPGITSESLELFGFWTYEFRVGHGPRPKTATGSGPHERWSTAQGRYGRPLRVTGLQHPPPHLTCALQRTQDEIRGTAAYATAVRNGVRVFDLDQGDPQTRIWFMLYAQVQRADGALYRNVLIDRGLGEVAQEISAIEFAASALLGASDVQAIEGVLPAIAKDLPATAPDLPATAMDFPAIAPDLPATEADGRATEEQARLAELTAPGVFKFAEAADFTGRRGPNRQPMASVVFSDEVIRRALSTLGLPSTSPLSMLAVELLPGRLDYETVPHDDGEDPLGADLGLRRILRTSPLVAVPPIC